MKWWQRLGKDTRGSDTAQLTRQGKQVRDAFANLKSVA